MKKYYKRITKGAINLTGTSMVLGAGSQVVGSMGGNTAGLNAFSGYLPVMGNVMGAGYTLGMVKQIGKTRTKH
jgi:hypothetical protein